MLTRPNTTTPNPPQPLSSHDNNSHKSETRQRTLTGKRCLSMARTMPAISTGVSPRCRSIARSAPTCGKFGSNV